MGRIDASHPHPSTLNPGEPTRQMVLQDEDFLYDVVGNPVEVRDWRDPVDWPAGAKPVTKKIEYDDLYRATRVRYTYAAGDDSWTSPFQAELDAQPEQADNRRAQPSPHAQFEKRILEQTFEYDWLGNNEKTTDDADGFYDRSLGDIDNGATDKPYQLRSASLAGPLGGSLQARYDSAGNMTGMALQRDGVCLGGAQTGDCNQQFAYDWDEVGRLVRARRWDNNTESADFFDPTAAGTPAADLRHTYDASDQRVIKEAVDPQGEQSFTLYVFASLELRRAQHGPGHAPDGSSNDYEVNSFTVVPYLLANGVRLARLAYHGSDEVPEQAPSTHGNQGDVNASTSQLHVFFELGDHLGSTSVVLDKATGELVERATFQAYGAPESDYRPGRWKSFREDYRFTGKEEDVEVGLQYFGKRFLNPLLGRWVSADPLAIHAPGEADLNLYAYVSGSVLKNVDPLGLDAEDAVVRGIFDSITSKLEAKGASTKVLKFARRNANEVKSFGFWEHARNFMKKIRGPEGSRLAAAYREDDGSLRFRTEEIVRLNNKLHQGKQGSSELSVGELYHEATHKFLAESQNDSVKQFVTRGEAYFRSKGVEDASTVFDEAVGNYVGHRANMWTNAKTSLDAILGGLRSGELDVASANKALARTEKDYARGAAERTFGYDSEGKSTNVALREDLRSYADSEILEGRVQDNFSETFSSELKNIEQAKSEAAQSD